MPEWIFAARLLSSCTISFWISEGFATTVSNFASVHTLKNGDTIKLTTQVGTRTYSVYSVQKVSVNDVSVLNPTTDNVVTLVTCVMNQPQYRWCVQARQK